ncbi:hypothetical protein LSTR_LSTR000970 [Laodelphax striatellus]|uniref:C2H2-type domain-containing protein n=1 Tax=Laodelphax striatellus TaxID=195883 RepID=A0A482X0V2_LAOST|nr:hypothetical protein LSTR_LSTR000970 [Laodelphax striatellus]
MQQIVGGAAGAKESDVYHCPDCDKRYWNRISLTRHRRYECGVAPQFMCTLCSRSKFWISDQHDNYLELSGRGPPFSCYQCGRLYSHKCNLKRHLRLECGVDPKFKCNFCKKLFKHRHHLNDHYKTQHDADIVS